MCTAVKSHLGPARKRRPNTQLPDLFFRKDIVIIGGEDRAEVRAAIRDSFGLPETHNYHAYRTFKAWTYPEQDMTVVLGGIGTGCIEPLVWELLDQRNIDESIGVVPKRIICLGTAGYIGEARPGSIFLVDGAYSVGTVLDTLVDNLSEGSGLLKANFPGLGGLPLPTAHANSTDLFYGCSQNIGDPRVAALRELDPALASRIDASWQPGRVIEMETVQTFALCRKFAEEQGLDVQYVGLRGVSNLADHFETEGDYSQCLLTQLMNWAKHIFAM